MAKKNKLGPKAKRSTTGNPGKAKRRKSTASKGTLRQSQWWSDKNILLSLGGILLLVFIVFLPALNNDFTNWDDRLYVVTNESITDLSFSGIAEMFRSVVVSNYHPITMLSLAINYKISGLEASGYIGTNIFFHLVNTFLVFLFVYKLTRANTAIALFVSLFFGIHPMHVESVAWISERKDVLYTFFFLLGLIGYVDYSRKPDLKKYLAILALLVLSLLSKPAAVVFPVVLLLIDYFENRKFTSKVLLEKLPFFAAALTIGIITIQVQSVKAMEVMERFDLWERLLFSGYGFVVYLVRLVVPLPLAALHPFPEPGNLPVFYLIAPVLALGLIFATYYFRRNRYLVFGILFYLVCLAPVLQFITIGNAIISERYSYVPYIGLLLIPGYFYWQVEQKKLSFPGGKNALRAILGIIAIVFSILSFQRTKVWKDSETLWTDAIQKYPENYRAYLNRGVQYIRDEQYDLGMADLNQSLSLNPNDAGALEWRGRTYQTQNQQQLALTDYNGWVNMDPQNPSAYIMRGTAFNALNRFDEALADYNKALDLDPNNIIALNNRGTLNYNKKRDYQNALNDFNRVIAIDPSYALAYLNRSRCYYALNDKAQAMQDAMKAQELGQEVTSDYLQLLR